MASKVRAVRARPYHCAGWHGIRHQQVERSAKDEAQLAALKAKLNRYQTQLDSGAAPPAAASAGPSQGGASRPPPPSVAPSGGTGAGKVRPDAPSDKQARQMLSPPIAKVLEDRVEPAASVSLGRAGGAAAPHRGEAFYQAASSFKSTDRGREELAALDARASDMMDYGMMAMRQGPPTASSFVQPSVPPPPAQAAAPAVLAHYLY